MGRLRARHAGRKAGIPHLATPLDTPEALAAREEVAAVVIESGFTSAFRVMTRVPLLPFDRFPNLRHVREQKVMIDDDLVVGTHGHTGLSRILIGSQARMPILLIFCGIIGGANVYGITGLIVGPILIAVLLNEGILHLRSFAKYAAAFFKISRSIVTSASSLRSRATGIFNCSRYFATVRRAISTPSGETSKPR